MKPVPNQSASEASESSAESLAGGYRALIEGAGIRIAGERLIIRVVGDDRASFMQGMCSNDIKGLASGALLPALFLTEHAHLIADAVIWAAGDALMLEMERTLWPAVRAHLERFLVADDVEMEEDADARIVEIDGPKAPDPVARAFGEDAASLPRWRHIEVGGARVASVIRYGKPAFTISAASAQAAREIMARMLDSGATGETREVTLEAAEIIRVESGCVRAGVDTTEKTIALEARLEPAISFSKGCYIGQETIERATARGGIKRRLFGLRFESGRMPNLGAPVTLEGREVGRVTSAVRSPRFGAIGLAILSHVAWTPGTRVTVGDAASAMAAIVNDLPFDAE
ncbi:MAG TPA: glycine cleavage T C-terminal barrel domain-containing protein [Candidatus Binataceae bacterium]|nr:glycine cleavage T C-terminal barrel domain-containing protein [Candidatus Binataceae bacterium]